ncbi:MAG: tetratricopeptide repeat protein [Acidobacteria bacterium]|nr:tetratricopeptide repeat protein [Acidobacteriota bacterium]
MAEDTSQQAHAWAYNNLRMRCALSYFASAVLLLTFCCIIAHAQMEPVSAPSPGVSTSGDTRTRARRVAEASDSTSAASSQARPTSEVNSEEPPATDQAPKTDRITALRAQINDATDRDERARLQRTLVDYLIALKRQSEAIKELRAMMREERIDPVGFYNIGNALARLGDTPTAIDAYRKAIDQRRGNYARALNNMGVLLIRQERWDEALQALSSALKQENFRYGEASYNLGRLYAARGETKLAINEWTRALAAQPDHLDAALLLARTLAANGETERAIAVIDAFVARQGPNKVLADTRNEILAGAVAGKAAPAAPAKP